MTMKTIFSASLMSIACVYAGEASNPVPVSIKLTVENAYELASDKWYASILPPDNGPALAALSFSETDESSWVMQSGVSESVQSRILLPSVASASQSDPNEYIRVKATITPSWVPVSNITWSGPGIDVGIADQRWISRKQATSLLTLRADVNYQGGGGSDTTEVAVAEMRINRAGNRLTGDNNTGENVGVENSLDGEVFPVLPVPVTWTWTIGGDIIRSYEHDPADPNVHRQIQFQDHNLQSIKFFWRNESAANAPHKLFLKGSAGQLVITPAEIGMIVGRYQDGNRELYCRPNHDGAAENKYNPNGIAGTYNTLNVHHQWHVTERTLNPYPGTDFFVFHRKVLDSYAAWATTFGYPGLPGANAIIQILPSYSYLTPTGGSIASPRYPSYFKRGDHANLDELGSSAQPYHNLGHVNAGVVDMTRTTTAPRSANRIFYGWHQKVDELRAGFP